MSALVQITVGLPLALGIVVLSAYDLRQGILPNRWVLLLALAAVACRCLLFTGSLPAGGFAGSAVGGLLVGGGTLALLRWLSHGGLGGGDVKFAAALGLWLGTGGTLVMLAVAFVAGGALAAVLLAKGTQRRTVPFGPFLGVAAWLAWLFGPAWLAWYEALLW